MIANHIARTRLALAVAVSLLAIASGSSAIELYEEDELGNVNQRNVGVFKQNSFDEDVPDGKRVKRNRPLQSFTSLKVEIPVTLVYRESGPARVEIEAAENIINKINFVQNGPRLAIRSAGFNSKSPITLALYGNKLQRVFVKSAADVSLHDISVNDFLLSVYGAGDTSVRGSANNCNVTVQGAADLDLSALDCGSTKLNAQGSSDIRVRASQSISGRVQGAGDVQVLGRPAERSLQAAGAFDIEYD